MPQKRLLRGYKWSGDATGGPEMFFTAIQIEINGFLSRISSYFGALKLIRAPLPTYRAYFIQIMSKLAVNLSHFEPKFTV